MNTSGAGLQVAAWGKSKQSAGKIGLGSCRAGGQGGSRLVTSVGNGIFAERIRLMRSSKAVPPYPRFTAYALKSPTRVSVLARQTLWNRLSLEDERNILPEGQCLCNPCGDTSALGRLEGVVYI